MSRSSVLGQQKELVLRLVNDLKPHPAFEKLGLRADSVRMSSLAKRGDSAFHGVVILNASLQIIEGYELIQLAKLRGRNDLTCLSLDLNEEDSLVRLLQGYQGAKGLNAFVRILLALELEPWFRDQARSNQSVGGRLKGSSNLTKAEHIDVRAQVAAAAGVSVGNISKAKSVLAGADMEIVEALKRNDVSLHRASLWSGLPPTEQRQSYRRFESERGITRLVQSLIARHRKASTSEQPSGATHLRAFLASLQTDRCFAQHIGRIEALLGEVALLDTSDEGVAPRA